MVNTAKYFALLESLRFEQALANKTHESQLGAGSTIAQNLNILEKYAKQKVNQELHELCTLFQLTAEEEATIDCSDPAICYIIRLQHALQMLFSNINFDSDAKEDLISVAHLKLCIQATQELSYYALRCQLHEDFLKSPIFQEAQGKVKCNPLLLLLSVQFYVRLLPIRQFHIANSMELVQRDLLAATMSLRSQMDHPQLEAILGYLWRHESKSDFFRHVLLLKATPLCAPLAKTLHQQLLGKLNSTQGYASFVDALQQTPNVSATRNAEIVAGIVARKGFTQTAQHAMILQVLEFCSGSLKDANRMCVGVLSLRRLYELGSHNQQKIEAILSSHWQLLSDPEDLISGLILMDHEELCNRILLWQHLFCSSSVACLPSSLLLRYLPLLLQLYDGLPRELPAKKQLAVIISRCLDNLEREKELPAVVQRLFKWELEEEPIWQCLHQRILILPSTETDRIQVKVAPADHQLDHDMGRVLPSLLMSSSHHALTCNVFLALLGFMIRQLQEKSPRGVDFLSTETELVHFLQHKYQLKLNLLIALNQLVSHQPLRAQLSMHTKEFLQLLKDLLQQRLAAEEEATDQTLLLILSLLQELLERSEDLQLTESTRELQAQLRQLGSLSTNRLIQQSVQSLLNILQGEWRPSEALKLQPFQKARSLIEEKESHLQVYGIQMLLDLLQRKDPATMAQGHVIIALALSTLKDKESYTFLNCVRLFVALVHVMEAEVLDKLSDEYLSETADLDYRLVVGEAILKAAQELGPLCYRYKAVLLNCFMHGSRSPLHEFRMSAFANLAQLCRLLAYQVQNFFQELLDLINSELSATGGYLPAKRAAVFVLAELLNGMDNLLDYQEMLLPIYRLLRAIEAEDSCDPAMRQHAANGLKILNDKCRQLIKNCLEARELHKDIKVMGIKDKPPARRKPHILELN
ncbi:transport and Golgi organization protein 6 [Drosophila obscura]|uniref:transport and Golgi organization protein 6 n=1 Tax=Drosophila obscura TaxID=7282 RepID=UPI001BB27EBB|nr:transport and Golgi organization protein 6 [Drosophila obscura]